MFVRFEQPTTAHTVECKSYQVQTSLEGGLHKKVTLDDSPVEYRVGHGAEDWIKAYVMNSEGTTIEIIHAPSAKEVRAAAAE